MNNKGKKMLAMLLSIIMCVSLLPVPALAEGTITAAEQEGMITAEEENISVAADEEMPAEFSETGDMQDAEDPVEKDLKEEPSVAEEEPTAEVSEAVELETQEEASTEEAEMKEESETAETYLASSGTCGDDLTWTLDDTGTLTISGTGAMKNYDAMATPWYRNRTSIKTVILNTGVTRIGNNAFEDCSELTNVTIPEGVTSISVYAFFACKKLTSITIPEGVKSIGTYAFGACDGLRRVTILEGTEIIQSKAFYYCRALKELKLPRSISVIDWSAFEGCSELKDVSYGGTKLEWGIIDFTSGNETLEEATIYYEKEITTGTCGENLIWNLNDKTKTLTILGTGEMNDYGDFDDAPWYPFRDYIETVVIEEGAESIGSCAFYDCDGLTRIAIPSSVIVIKSYAFYKCNNLSDVDYGDTEGKKRHHLENENWEEYRNYSLFDASWHYSESADGWDYCGNNVLWKYDSSSRCLTIKGSGEMWDYSIFSPAPPWHEKAGRIVSVSIGSGITSIGSGALSDCTKVTSLILPGNLISIGDYAFYGCEKLKDVQIPASVRSIGIGAFSGCASLLEATIPSGVTSIDESLFYECSSLTSITIPESVTSIGRQAFSYCYNLQNITLPSKIKTIDYFVFTHCSSLDRIVIPASVVSISGYAFAYCMGLKTIVFQGDVPNISSDAFIRVTADAYYPKDADWWEDDLLDYGGKLTWHPYSTEHQEFKLNKSSLNLPCGKSETLKASGNATVLWFSKDSSVATVNGSGKVTGKKVGKTEIFASSFDGSYQVSCKVRVLFKDVTDSSLFYFEPIYTLFDKGVIGGYDDGTFRPTGNCNRAAVVTFLWKLAGRPEPGKMATFKDMTTNEDFNKAISWAAEEGITSGWSDNTFRPWNTCNRAAIVTFLWRYAGEPEPKQMATFKDMTGNADFDKAISWAAENGITTGYDGNLFKPWNTCNRLAVASFLDRYDKLG